MYKRNERLEKIFDLVAKDFETVGPCYFTYFGHQLIERSEITKGKKVLDVACGRGASLFKAADTVGSSNIIGVDFSMAMINELLDSAREKGFHDLRAIKMDAENLLFDDGSFDNVYCGLSLHFFSNPLLAIEEMHRVLKDRGKLGISTWGIKRKHKKGVYERAYERVFPEASNNMSRAGNDTPDFSSEKGLKEILISKGFSDVVVQVETKTFFYETKEIWWNEQSNNAVRGFFERIKTKSPELFHDFKKAAFEEIEKDMINGRIEFDAVVLYGYGVK